MTLESFRIAIKGVLSNRLRSALTVLGIMIGVAAVILLVAVGSGSSLAVQQRIESLGTNSLVIFSGGFGRGFGGGGGGGGASRNGTASRRSQLTAADVKALQNKQNAPDIKAVAPSVTASATGAYQGATYSPQQFVGTTASFFEIRKYTLAAGSAFTDDDVTNHAKVAVLGQTVVTNLFGAGTNPLGARVKFGGAAFNVIGVLEAKGSNGFQDQDDVVIAPITAVQDTLAGNTGSYNNITVEAASRDQTDAASAEITAVLTSTHRLASTASPDFQVLNQASLLATSNETGRIFTVLLGAVAAISLVVGGIGVMNIMLVTVTERTREIGIRKAIGAQRRDILSQFLLEAVVLSVLGGAAGVAAGVGGARFKIAGVAPVVQPYSVFLAFGVAVLIGLFFGIYPANRAATLSPIDALRHE
jgi:putative ABC transport system permease protein